MTLWEQYRKATWFGKPTVLRDGYRHPVAEREGLRWLVLGPGHLWLGCTFESWDQAVLHALEGHDD